jgi:hypothetical protein
MRLQDLIFHEIEGSPPLQWCCNSCGNPGVTLATAIQLSGGEMAMIVLCSRACESVLKRHPMADQFLAELLARIESGSGGEIQWPELIDA